MALKKPYSIYGIALDGAYFKVSGVSVEETGETTAEGLKTYTVQVSLCIYTDETKEHELNGDTKNFLVTSDDEGMYTMCACVYGYKLLKETDEFADAVDC